MKICARCGQDKPDVEFGRSKGGRLGLNSYCRPCMAEYQQEWRKQNPDAVRAERRRAREAREANPEEYAAIRRAEYQRRLERNREYSRQWRADNPEKVAARNARYRQRARAEGWDRYYRHGTTQEQLQAILTAQAGGCAICGTQLKLSEKRTHVDHSHAEGHIRGILCGKCNASLGWFETRADRVQEYLSSASVHPGKQPAAPKPPVEERFMAGRGWPQKTHCRRGHPFTDDNVYVNKKTGARRCKTCTQAYARSRAQAKRAG